MRSLNTWTRLEPQTRDESMSDSLQARVHDPLWLLGRQWQVGEFEGEDAGSLIDANLGVAHDYLTRYRPGSPEDGADSRFYDSRVDEDGVGPPLETLVERESVRPPSGEEARRDLRLTVEAGLHALRLLARREFDFDATDFPDLRVDADEFDLETDDDGRRFSRVVGETLDGDALYRALVGVEPGDFPRPESLNPGQADDYEKALETYREWYADLYSEPDDEATPWRDDRLEYRFGVSTGTGDRETVFEAEEYPGGRLDWHSFDVDENGSLAPGDESATDEWSREVVPSRMEFPGMPVPRWWELEDANLDLSRLEAGGEDLSRMLFREFALLYGNDWFVVPITVPVGSLTRITSLEVTNTFGETFDVAPAGSDDNDWNAFAFDVGGDGTTGLFVPPVLGGSLETEPVETVEFARDEMANVAWAIEKRVESALGDPLDRHEAESRPFPPEEPNEPVEPARPAEGGERPPYRLASDVPDYWYPLLPWRESLGHVRLRRGRVLQPDEKELGPYGRILGVEDLSLHEEEVPRSGVTVSRAYQYVRWIDGSTHVWCDRTKKFGRGETSSGLTFDYLETES